MRPFHPAVKAALQAVDEMARRGVDGETARRRVRVEMTHEVDCDLRMHLDPVFSRIADTRGIGPMQIMGIDFYVVFALPEPGWRVIAA